LIAAARKAAMSLGRQLTTSIAIFPGAGTAFVVGILRPVVLVNVSLISGLTPQQLQQILVHELAHIYRFDPVTQLLQRVVESVLFFHPGIWWISREVSHLRELCCDDLAAQTSTPVEFADTLLHCYQLQKSQMISVPELALSAIGAQKSQLIARVDALVEGESTTKSLAAHRNSFPLLARLCVAAVFLFAAKVALSSGSLTQIAASNTQSESQLPQSNWQRIDNVDDSSIEAPGLWFNGMRLETSSVIPDDVLIDAMVDADACRFCQWYFGNTLCNRVAVLVEMDGDQPVRVFLDSNRNRTIETDEEITSQIHDGKVWIADLAAHVGADNDPGDVGAGEDTIAAPRQVAIYPRKDRVRIRTLGYSTGDVQLEDKSHTFRRVDIDGDGIPVGTKDQLWVDLDDSGNFDPISERFNMADQISIGEKQYTVRSDRLGHTVTLASLDTVGKLQFTFELADKSATLEKLEGTLRDENGMLISVRLSDEPIPVPPGQYCLEHLVLHVRGADKTTWRMTLARGMEAEPIEITPDSSQTIQLLDDFQFHGKPVHEPDRYSGFESHVQASVYTKNGLVITDFKRAKKGESENNNINMDRLVNIRAANSEVPEGWTCSGFN